jgi:DNA excision repair protein ERCC-2
MTFNAMLAGSDELALSPHAGSNVSRALPKELLRALRNFTELVPRYLIEHPDGELREELLELFFGANRFLRTAERFDEHYVTVWDHTPAGPSQPATTRVRLFCLNPARQLSQALKRADGSVFFSATLTPADHFRELLGGKESDGTLQLNSPFAPENLLLLIYPRVSTTYKSRDGTVDEVAAAIAALVRSRKGNYLVYFPSYRYLENVLARFTLHLPQTEVLKQSNPMTEKERELFLQSFSTERETTLVGFAVMGGIFGEGIDLVGDRLIGVVIVGVGLPQICLDRNLLRAHFDQRNGPGFDYAYTFPGMNRVLQAAGRVIRTATDRGVVLLIDKRFGSQRYQKLFPRSWRPIRAYSPGHIQKEASRFWSNPGESSWARVCCKSPA